ncbi:MAG TPA: type II secretion system protein [Nocardioidaceae bacterium]|nr:type II secretion system protein [Nocardioidaceae bacterium]
MTALATIASCAVVLLCFRAHVPLETRRRRRVRRPWPLLLVGALACVLALRGPSLVLALLAAGFGAALAWLRARGRARTLADATRLTVIEACEALASELRSGQPAPLALSRAASVWPGLDPVVAASRLDADVAQALRRASTTPGAQAVAGVAAAWAVSQSVGGGLAHALDRVVDRARGELATHRVVAAELASAQATARMVAILPVFVLVLSGGSGADPWGFMFETTPGLCCLGGGLALALAGLWWIDRIVVRVEAGDL